MVQVQSVWLIWQNSILVMGTYTGEGGYLAECLQMFSVFGRGEGRPIVV